MLWDIIVVHGDSFSNPVHVDEMVEEKSHSFSVGTAHNPANLEGIHFSYFYIGKTNGCFTLFSSNNSCNRP
jgi:acetate kinase